MITALLLHAALPGAALSSITRFAQPLADACAEFGIDTPRRIAAFLAQVAHESGMFSHLTENLNYSAEGLRRTWPSRFSDPATAMDYARRPEAIANRVYANRMGNGDEASGDGWRFRGRGLIQITGREVYLACGAALGLPLLARPEMLEETLAATRSAGWYWKVRRLNPLADAGDVEAITRRINGGLNGLPERKALYGGLCDALDIPVTVEA